VLKSAAGSTFKDTLSYTLEISMFNISAPAGKAASPSGVLSWPVQPFVAMSAEQQQCFMAVSCMSNCATAINGKGVQHVAIVDHSDL